MCSILKKFNACSSGQQWADSQKDYRTAWNTCNHDDWMLWIAKTADIDLKMLTLAKAKRARLVEHLMTEEKSLKALDVSEKFASGEATIEELNSAAYAAYAAYARAKTLKQCSDICREITNLDDIEKFLINCEA